MMKHEFLALLCTLYRHVESRTSRTAGCNTSVINFSQNSKMVSLNELDEKLASLEQSDGESESSCSESGSSTSTLRSKSRAVGMKSHRVNDAQANAVLKKKRRQGLSTICFQHLKGFCQYSKTCVFRHVSATKLESDDRIEIMRELRLRTFDADLAKVITDLNIPHCKSFSKTSACKFAHKCQYWHIDNAAVAKWAGFPFWCHSCTKAFTSEAQLLEHNKGKLHLSKTR